jgi:polygalacturonase
MLAALALLIAAAASTVASSPVCDISDYGAEPGSLDPAVNTAAFNRALAVCCVAASDAWHVAAWREVFVPAGVFLLASLDLSNCSNVQLHISPAATLLGSAAESDYPLVPPWPSYGSGRDVPTSMRYRPFIYARNVTNFRVTGGGVVDGNGEPWCAGVFITAHFSSHRAQVRAFL